MRSIPLFLILTLAATACTFEPREYGPPEGADVEEPEPGQPPQPQPDGAVESAVPGASVDGGLVDTGISDAFPCVPWTCTSAGASCGAASDGCGGMLDCGDCPSGQQCGAAGLPNHCAPVDDGGSDAGPACSAGERACVGLQVYECDASGSWTPAETCSMSCVNGACEDSCPLPWGGTLAHGQSTTAFLNAAETSPTMCSDNVETRVCDNGTLSGSYTNPACAQQFRECPLAGYGTLLHNTQVTSYVSASVPCGSTCASTTISCHDGTLSGGSSYHASCTVDSCNCQFSHGQGFTTLSPGQSCSSHLVNVNTTSGCTGGVQHYDGYDCTYTCNANGTVTRSSGGPCEIGNGACGGSVSGSSTTTCPDGW